MLVDCKFLGVNQPLDVGIGEGKTMVLGINVM